MSIIQCTRSDIFLTPSIVSLVAQSNKQLSAAKGSATCFSISGAQPTVLIQELEGQKVKQKTVSSERVNNLLLNLRSTVDKVVIPELEGRVFDKLNEGDQKTPRMWAVDYQSLQQNPAQDM